jgi:transcription-repair coupling factor (superfamily II helicase)
MAKKLGIEKIILKNGKMTLYLITNSDSPYYQSEAFDKLLEFVKNNYRICQITEKNNRRYLSVEKIDTVEKAVRILEEIGGMA